jgi:diguanylate cyclase (GGDEF)-like protein
MRESLSRLQLARVSAGFIVLAGVLGAVRAALVPAAGTDSHAILILSGVAVAAGTTAALLPWNRLPRPALGVLALLSLGLIGANGYLTGEDARINSIYYVVVFMWVGLALPRGSCLALAPVLALSFAAPLVALGRSSELLALSLLVPACVFVGEVARWLTLQLARAEHESAERAEKMATLVEATLELATCQETETLAKLVAENASTLHAGVGSMVLLHEEGAVRVAGSSGWPTVLDESLESVEVEIVLEALQPGRMPLDADRLACLAESLGVAEVEVLPVQGSGEPVGAVLVAFTRAGSPVDEFTQYVVCAFATQAGLGFERLRRTEMLRDESLRDPLTEVGNRRSARAALEVLKPGDAVAMLDLDHFKNVNDTFGHAAGDRVLRTVADFLRASVRGPDEVYRYGGEEFLVVLTGAGATGTTILERIHLAWQSQKRAATFSAGIAVHRDGDHFEATLGRADAALYDAKRLGRNRVVCAPNPV